MEEERSNTNYYLKSKQRNQENFEISYFYCNRSGKSSVLPDALRKRSIKSQGSCKLNMFCTSQIRVKQNIITGKCNVKYCYEYYGHDTAVQHVRLHKVDRESIASKIILGVSVSNILDSSKTELSSESGIRRIDLLVKKDIHNIKASYNLNITEGCRHKDDATSVKLFVLEWSKMEANPVLFYKAQDEDCKESKLKKQDFCIILMTDAQIELFNNFGGNIITIDGTHGLNGYDFEMTTIMVIDEFGEGLPVAFMYSNRKDSFIYEIFFTKIKEKLSILNTKTFMSDLALSFYNAWEKVMGQTIPPSDVTRVARFFDRLK
ncbi:uncharacterized protein [Diabrotica undecimpunctata]|uniref:uncharacterized protein n=1 Tax=Diabrotica undecimpunctata TaxID=50387 RepID=UPI003B634B4A